MNACRPYARITLMLVTRCAVGPGYTAPSTDVWVVNS